MKFFTSTLSFTAMGIILLGFGFFSGDPRMFSFGVVWILIATAKHLLISRKQNIKRSN